MANLILVWFNVTNSPNVKWHLLHLPAEGNGDSVFWFSLSGFPSTELIHGHFFNQWNKTEGVGQLLPNYNHCLKKKQAIEAVITLSQKNRILILELKILEIMEIGAKGQIPGGTQQVMLKSSQVYSYKLYLFQNIWRCFGFRSCNKTESREGR